MAIERPLLEELDSIVRTFNLTMGDHEMGLYKSLTGSALDTYDVVDELPDHLPEIEFPREKASEISKHTIKKSRRMM